MPTKSKSARGQQPASWHPSPPALLLAALLLALPLAQAEISLQIGGPGISIGINVPTYPRLVRVPGYPVYYSPQGPANYFFYDGLYWVYTDDNWYESHWYDGPWHLREPAYVPLFLLRVPVRYYRRPPTFFRGWRADEPPRWDERWGPSWQQQHEGWRRWDRRASPAPAPLPIYQQRYSGRNYPRDPERQQALHAERYRFQPREPVSQQRWQSHDGAPSATVPPPVRAERPHRPERPELQAPPLMPTRGGAAPSPHPGAEAQAPQHPPEPQAEGRGRKGGERADKRDDKRHEKRDDKRDEKGDDKRDDKRH